MKTRKKWVRFAVTVVIAIVATVSFASVERALSARRASAAPVHDEGNTAWNQGYYDALEQMEQDRHDRYARELLAPDVEGTAWESTISFEQYSAALEQGEQIWNARYLARFRSRPDDMMERAFVTEEYNAAHLWGGNGAAPMIHDMESTISFEQYSAALEQGEQIWNARYLARFRSRPDDVMERAFVTEEYNAAHLWGGYGAARTGKYGGDWLDVYGSASGLLELELADPALNPAIVSHRTYGGDWFDVYGNASGLLELELADPQFANP